MDTHQKITASVASGNHRIRKCIEKIIEMDGIRSIDDVDFKKAAFANVSISQLTEIISDYWKSQECPHERIVTRWMGDKDEFNPYNKESGWYRISNLLYSNIKYQKVKTSRSMLVWSPVEMWHVCYRTLVQSLGAKTHAASNELVYSLKTSMANEPMSYFYMDRSNLGQINPPIFEIDTSKMSNPDVKKARTVMGMLPESLIRDLMKANQVPINPKSLMLHKTIGMKVS